MNNYIKCKYPLGISDSDQTSINVDLETVNFLCKPIEEKLGDFLIRRNGELCHNVIEYEKVGSELAGESGVLWNGTGYAKVKSKKWDRVNLCGDLEMETQIMSKKTDAVIKVNFNFLNGYVSSCDTNVILIDNSDRLKHTEKIKNQAIKRAKKMNTTSYKIYKSVLINPLINLCIYLRYPLIFCQEMLIKLEQKLNKKL
jgi:hypothetical protein